MTYDPYGKPMFENPANQPLTDGFGDPIAGSEFKNSYGFLGKRYDPELGSRSSDVHADMGGLYLWGSSPLGLIGGSPLSLIGQSPLSLIGNSPLSTITITEMTPIRYYSPTCGRFVSRNDISPAGSGRDFDAATPYISPFTDDSFINIGIGELPQDRPVAQVQHPYAIAGDNPVSSILGTTYSPGGSGDEWVAYVMLGTARPAGGASAPVVPSSTQTHAGGSAWWDQLFGGRNAFLPSFLPVAPNWRWTLFWSIPPVIPPGPGPDPGPEVLP